MNGKWKTLSGEAGIHAAMQDQAAGVVFTIKNDGKEAFRSATITGSEKPTYNVDLEGVKKLELIVTPSESRNVCNWALWLSPMLSR